MGLDFVESVEDKIGAAIYLIHDGSGYESRRLEEYSERLKRHTRKQIVIFDGREEDGAEICDFYDLMELPAIIIVRDDDELYRKWSGMNLPQPDEVAFLAEQVG